jgi:hypothetical protein
VVKHQLTRLLVHLGRVGGGVRGVGGWGWGGERGAKNKTFHNGAKCVYVCSKGGVGGGVLGGGVCQ